MRRALVLAGLLLAAGGAMAQQAVLEPSAALQCLSPPTAQRGEPTYPFEAFKQGLSGRVKVRLRFAGPDRPPGVKVLSHQGDDSFVDAVRAHVATLRVPCHDGRQDAAELEFDFVFRAGDGTPVASAVPVDPAEAERQRQKACLTRTDGSAFPEYPWPAQMAGAEGRVLVQMRFDAPDQPPAVRVLPRVGGDGSGSQSHPTRHFVEPLRTWAAGYRLPCLQGGPLTITTSYVFRGAKVYGFTSGLTFRQLLPMVRGIRQQRLQFDFTRMGCPFDVSVNYRQPNLPNAVRDPVGNSAAHAAFADWLRQMQLDLPEPTLDLIYGDDLTFTVPCFKLDLNPQE
ncbi:hypothetical protein [Pseudaquabacterium pictum]|uniref:TonB C-terminal domain-containing protein n=1 Tax=Pseudaquabacterium pictum TaxID=2315236 RepID=A0A480AZV1_9BURK|nr:hypothetical protein [Rubrivivax pictus]GCL65832.1 hypothetical protein AQPW35_49130 [Rubrivivax pictus]